MSLICMKMNLLITENIFMLVVSHKYLFWFIKVLCIFFGQEGQHAFPQVWRCLYTNARYILYSFLSVTSNGNTKTRRTSAYIKWAMERYISTNLLYFPLTDPCLKLITFPRAPKIVLYKFSAKIRIVCLSGPRVHTSHIPRSPHVPESQRVPFPRARVPASSRPWRPASQSPHRHPTFTHSHDYFPIVMEVPISHFVNSQLESFTI